SHRHRHHLGRGQRVAHEYGRVIVVVDDVDLLAAEFRHHRPHPGTVGPDAGALGVETGDGRLDGDLRTVTGLTGDRRDPDRPVTDLRDLEREEAAHEVGVGAGERDRRTVRALVYAHHVTLDALSVVVRLSRDLLCRGESPLGTPVLGADVDHDDPAGVGAGVRLDHAA